MRMGYRSSSRRTGVQEVVTTFATRVAILLSGVGIQSLLAYALLPSGRGAFAVCTLFAALLGVLFTPGADAGAQYFVMSKKMSLSQGVAVSLAICAAGSGLAVLVAIPLIQSDLPFFRKSNTGDFYISLVLVPLNTFAASLQNQLSGLRRYGRLAWISLMRIAVNGLLLVLLVLSLGHGVLGAVVASCVSSFVMILACIKELKRRDGLAWELPSWSCASQVIRYGLGYYLARIGWGVDVRIGVLILGMLAETAEVGVFSVASGLMMQFILISNAVFVPLLPRTASDQGGRPNLVTFCARCTTWVTTLALIPFLVFGVPIVRTVLSAEFLQVVPLTMIIAPGILMFAGANVLTAYFRSIDRPDVCSWAVGIGVGINGLLVPLLYGTLGLQAAAWGMTLALSCRSILLAFVFYRMTSTGLISSWLPQRGDGRRLYELITTAMRGRDKEVSADG